MTNHYYVENAVTAALADAEKALRKAAKATARAADMANTKPSNDAEWKLWLKRNAQVAAMAKRLEVMGRQVARSS